MAWYDTIVDIKNTAVEFLKNDTVQDIAGVASEFLGDGKADTQSQIALMKAPSLGSYKVSPDLGRSSAGKPKFTEFSRDGGPKPAYILPGSKGGETFMDWVSELVKKEFKSIKNRL